MGGGDGDGAFEAGDVRGEGSLGGLAAMQLLDDVAGIVDDGEPAVVGSVLDGFLFGSRIGKDDVVVRPVIGDAGDPESVNG